MAKHNYVNIAYEECLKLGWHEIWVVNDIFCLVMGSVANLAMLWLMLRERKSLSASQVLGLNLVVMDLLYLCTVPIGFIYYAGMDPMAVHNSSEMEISDFTVTVTPRPSPTLLETALAACNILLLIGCPLLLTCMCVERYLAVMKPVLYLRVRRWEYRAAVTSAAWAMTLVCLLSQVLGLDFMTSLLGLSALIICLFVLMLACLGAMIWSLRRPSPAHTARANTVKRRAVVNVAVVVVPTVVSYLPTTVMFPLAIYIQSTQVTYGSLCNFFEISSMFPRFGLFIGPLFYLGKARQMCRLRVAGRK